MDLFKSYDLLDVYKHSKLFRAIRRDLLNLLADCEMSYPLDVRIMHATQGSLKFPDAYIIKHLLYRYKPKTILEIGSFLGFSTRWLLEVSRGWNARVTAVDPNIRHRCFDNPRWFIERLNSRFYPDDLEIVTAFFGTYGDYVYGDYTDYKPKRDRDYVDRLIKEIEIIDKNWERRFDFIFIDGDHSYKSVMNNFETAIGLLNEGGCITFHDAISWEGVDEALRNLRVRYDGRAEVKIYGNFDRAVLTFLRKPFNDGIGLFRLL